MKCPRKLVNKEHCQKHADDKTRASLAYYYRRKQERVVV